MQVKGVLYHACVPEYSSVLCIQIRDHQQIRSRQKILNKNKNSEMKIK